MNGRPQETDALFEMAEPRIAQGAEQAPDDERIVVMVNGEPHTYALADPAAMSEGGPHLSFLIGGQGPANDGEGLQRRRRTAVRLCLKIPWREPALSPAVMADVRSPRQIETIDIEWQHQPTGHTPTLDLCSSSVYHVKCISRNPWRYKPISVCP